MTKTPTDDPPSFMAEEPEHCHDCYRLICPCETYFLTIERAVVCPGWIRVPDAILLSGGLAVEVGEERLLVRRSNPSVKVYPHEARHVMDALVGMATRLVDGNTREE